MIWLSINKEYTSRNVGTYLCLLCLKKLLEMPYSQISSPHCKVRISVNIIAYHYTANFLDCLNYIYITNKCIIAHKHKYTHSYIINYIQLGFYSDNKLSLCSSDQLSLHPGDQLSFCSSNQLSICPCDQIFFYSNDELSLGPSNEFFFLLQP